jgi:predicted metal-dependent hydrolase
MSASIPFRNRRFGLTAADVATCAAADPIAHAFYAGLSTTFPDGERFFVQSVKAHEAFVGPNLADDVAAFVRQEGAHAREHRAMNDQLGAHGYAMDKIVARAQRQLAACAARAPIQWLATTIALEHFTAVFARQLLADPRHLAFCDDKTRALWQWHAVEEIEHKSVAFDVFLSATQHMSGLGRWLLRAAAMTDAIVRLVGVIIANIADMLAADGKADALWPARFVWFVFFKPGIVGQMSLAIAAYYRAGFHPAEADDGGLVRSYAAMVSG